MALEREQTMKLSQYFANAEGVGILATADADGKVDQAIYETPEVIDDETIALHMLERLSYSNIRQNPNACYIFIERVVGAVGHRFYLEMVDDKPGSERVAELRSQGLPVKDPALSSKRYVVYKVTHIRPLVGFPT